VTRLSNGAQGPRTSKPETPRSRGHHFGARDNSRSAGDLGYSAEVSRFCLGVALGLLLLGCADDDSDQGCVDYCSGLCEGLERCELSDSGCVSRCLDLYHPRGTRSSGLSRIGECLRHESCTTLNSDDSQDGCWDAAAEQEPLRPALKSYCEGESLNNFRCNIFWSVADCVKVMGLWEDALLARAQECQTGSCESLSSCEKAVFESP
jgi:hypothetical protein